MVSREMVVSEAKRVFKRGDKLEINPLLVQAFGITPEEIMETIRSAEEPEAMRDMFAFLSDYATLSEPGTRLSISDDRLDFLVADMKRRMAYVEKVYRSQAEDYSKFYPETAKQLLKISEKARELYNFKGISRKDKVAFIDEIAHLEHTSGSIIPIAFGISDYGREDYWPRTLLEFLRSHGMPGVVKEGTAPDTGKPKINWNLNVRDGKIVYMPPEEYMERVNIFNRIGMSMVIEQEQRAKDKGYRGIGYYPPLSESSYRSVLAGIRAGNEMDIPNIVYRNGKVENQEGFHRSLVARDLGIDRIPVHVIGEIPSVFYRALNLNWNQNLTEQVKAINALKGKVIGGVFMISEGTTPAPEPGNKEFRANPNLINRDLAMRSHSGTSWDPEKRGEQEIADFVAYVQEVYEHLKKYAKTDRQKEYLLTEMERFQSSFASKYNAKLSAQGGCLSTMIAGPSKFPVRRAEKACNAADKRYEELIEFRDRAEAAILRELKKMGVEEAGGEIEVLKKKIADAERNHELMVKTNVIVRKKIPDDQKVREIMALGPISEKTAREVLKPDFMNRVGFPAYALSNDTANIHRMKERLKELEKKEVTPTGEIPFTGGYIIDNREEDRVQIIFDQRPSQAIIDRLKSEGWRWSPSNSAWQRKRTENALYSARRITGAAQPVPAVRPQAAPAPMPLTTTPSNNINSLAKLRASEWFKTQISNPYERYYLYHRIGDFVVSNTEPQGYTLSHPDRISTAWTVEQATQWIINTAQRLPILPLDIVPPATPAVQPQAAPPVPAPSQDEEVHARIQKVIDIMKIYRDKGATYEDLLAGLKGYYLEQSGYVMGDNLNVQKLIDDLKKSGYNNLRELWRKIIVQAPERVPAPQPTAITPTRTAEEIMTVPHPEKMTRDEFIKEKFSRAGQVLRQRGNVMLAEYMEKGTDPEYKEKFAAFHKDRVLLVLLSGRNVPDEVLKDYPDIAARFRKGIQVLPSISAPPLLYPAQPQRPAEEIMFVPNPETLTKEEFVKEKYRRYAQVLRQQGKIAIAERVEKGARDPEWTYKYETSHRDQVVLALAQGKQVSPEVLKDYPDIVARVRKENEEIIAGERAERERLLAIERAEENELTAELNKLPPPLKRHAETEIYGTLHMPDTHKDYRNRYNIAMGIVRRIAYSHLPGVPQQPVQPQIPVPTVPAAKPVQSMQDVKQQVINSMHEAKSMDELRQILRGLGFLPLPESEKRQLIDLYQVRTSELMGELKFGERITEEETKKKRRAPQRTPYVPPSRRLEEFGVREAMRQGYGYA